MSENKVWCPIFTPTFREHLLWWAKKAVRTRVPYAKQYPLGQGHNIGVRRLPPNGGKGMLTKTEPSKVNKILDLVEVVCQQPFKGIGKPEPLKYLDSDIWSRRINLEHRLVYRIKGDRLYFLQCRYHYD